MKKKLLLLFTVFILLAVLPFVGIRYKERSSEPKPSDSSSPESYFRIKDDSCGKIIKIKDKELLLRVLAYEMPALYEQEALKAQCVASYSHLCYLREHSKSSDYDLSGDVQNNGFYLNDDEMKKRFGENYKKYRARLQSAVDAVFPQKLTDGGKVIDALYFALSSGNTENYRDVFGIDEKHHRAVASPLDMLSPEYISKKTVSSADAEKILKPLCSGQIDILKMVPTIKDAVRTRSGYIKSVKLFGKTFTGEELRKLFSLRSGNFTASYDSDRDTLSFTVYGYGHGVGMSQFSANEMAKQGETYTDILARYYNKATITN